MTDESSEGSEDGEDTSSSSWSECFCLKQLDETGEQYRSYCVHLVGNWLVYQTRL